MSKEKSNQQISNSEEAITTQPVNSNPQITSSPTSIDVPTSEGCYDAECDNVCTFLECVSVMSVKLSSNVCLRASN